MNELEKMIAGLPYNTSLDDLPKMRAFAHDICRQFNALSETQESERAELIKKLIPTAPNSAYMQGPIFFDYGFNTTVGKNFYANFNLTILDCCPVTIGDDVLIGPNVSILTPMHPFCPSQRNIKFSKDGSAFDYEYAKPIVIGKNCWIAGNVTIIGGVTIGEGCVIGAGSVVTRDIPPHSLAVGNPCRVIRQITDDDLIDGIPLD